MLEEQMGLVIYGKPVNPDKKAVKPKTVDLVKRYAKCVELRR
jgi:hypothetical protein